MTTHRLALALLLSGCGLDGFTRDKNDGPSPVGDDTGSHTGDVTPIDTGGTGFFNTAPVADAGDDLTVAVADVVVLDGSGSYDGEDDELRYRWELVEVPSGSGVALLNDDRVDPSFLADAPGDFVVALVVNDGTYDSSPDEVVITAERDNGAPTADAGPDQSVTTGDTVYLDGTGSSDPDGDALDYEWSFTSLPAGSAATLNSTTAAHPSFVADLDGNYTLELVVTDSGGDSDSDTVRITASEDSGSSGDCLGCSRMGEVELKRRFALLGLPLFFGWRIRRRR